MTTDAGIDELQTLKNELGGEFRVRRSPTSGAIVYLDGRSRPIAATPDDAMRIFRAILDGHPQLFGRDRALTVRSAGVEVDDLGFLHAHLETLFDGRRVFAGDLRADFSADGELLHLRSNAWTPAPRNQVILDAQTARTRAALDARDLRPDIAATSFSTRAPDVWVFPVSSLESRFVWRVSVTADDALPVEMDTFIDAENGDIVRRHDHIHALTVEAPLPDRTSITVEATWRNGLFYLEDDTHPTTLKTYSTHWHTSRAGALVTTMDPSLFDPEAVALYRNLERAYDYFSTIHHLHTWLDGDVLRVTLHFGVRNNAAFFDRTRIVMGDGDEYAFLPLGRASDIVMHELAHSVTQQFVALIPADESGAIDEGIADLFAAFGELRSGSAHPWQIGASVHYCGGASPVSCAIRDLASPIATGNASSLAEQVTTPLDNGGVHANSTIVSHAGYLMTVGDSARAIDPLVAGAAELIWFRAMRYYLPPDADFTTIAEATLAATADYGFALGSVRAAWNAVGINVGDGEGS